MFSFPVFICFVCSDVCQIASPLPRHSPSHTRDPSRATRCALLGAVTTPEWSQPGLAWPAVRSTYVSCLPAEISFLLLSLFGVGGLVVFPAAAASLAGLAFSGWAFAFALRSTVHWPCNFLFTFLTPKISLGQKGWVLYALTCATLGIFGDVGELGEILMANGQIFWFVCFSFELFSQHTFTGRPA